MLNSTREFQACVHVRGKPVTEVVFEGRTYIEGRKKSSYELSFRNNTSQDVLAVPAVDGLSVIDGQPAGKESPGFVVGRWSEIVIPGWTVDGETAAEFIFHSKDSGKTYAEESDQDPLNQGVIGIMVFREIPRRAVPHTIRSLSAQLPHNYPPATHFYGSSTSSSVLDSAVIGSSHNAGDVQSSFTASADSLGNLPENVGELDAEEMSLGTGFGDAVDFETQRVEFRREADPCALFTFYYDTKKNLSRMGVPVEQFNRHYSQSYDNGPAAFPNSPEVTGYAKPPAGWTGRRRKSRS